MSLTEEMLTSALQAIRRGTLSTANYQLLHMHSVDLVLEVDFSNDESFRWLALTQVLSSHILQIVNSLSQQHANIQISGNSNRASICDVLCTIAKPAPRLLLGALWVYVYYCRFDLDIDRAEFCKHASIDKRTLQRLQAHCVQRLMFSLLKGEVNARKKLAKLALPRSYYHGPLHDLTESIKLISHLVDLVTFSSKYIVVQGSSISVMTVLLSQVVHHIIDNDVFDDVFWINTSQSIYNVFHALRLGGMRRGYRAFVVVDNADKILSESPYSLDSLLEVNPQISLLISTSKSPASLSKEPFHVVSIDIALAIEVHRYHFAQSVYSYSYRDQLSTVSSAQSAGYLNLGNQHSVLETINPLDTDCKIILLIMSLMRDGICSSEDLEDILADQAMKHLASSIDLLNNAGLLKVWKGLSGKDSYSVDHQVRAALGKGPHSQQLLSALEVLSGYLLCSTNQAQLQVVESILLHDLMPNVTTKHRLINGGIDLGIKYGHWLEWLIILEEIYDYCSKWCYTYALCCIGLGQIRRGQHLMKAVIASSGRKGHFQSDGDQYGSSFEQKHVAKSGQCLCGVTNSGDSMDSASVFYYTNYDAVRSSMARAGSTNTLLLAEHNRQFGD